MRQSTSAKLILIALLCFAALPHQFADAQQEPFDAIMKAAFQDDKPGAAAIVVKDGKTIYKAARGMADLELNVPLKVDMVFRIGSITKQFTAAAIMILAEEGKLSLEDEITKFLPDYPTNETKITLRHLLDHTSGIRSYTSMPKWMETKIKQDLTPQELIDGFKNEPMDFKPGEKFQYNNSAYVILGAVIEKASGMTYAEFIQKRIFDAVGMSNSYYGDHEDIIPNRASGYDGTAEQPKNAQYLSMTQPYAAGSLLSTVEDLAKWNAALFNNRVINAESLELMTTAGKLNDGSETEYGLGLFLGEVRGHQSIFHGGGIFGYVCMGVYLPEHDVYVAVLCNSTFKPPVHEGMRMAALAAGDPIPEFKAVERSEEELRQFVGVYKIDEETRRFVTVKNGVLYTQLSGKRQLPAVPASDNRFFYETNMSWFEFETSGESVTMKMYADGKKEAELAVKVDEEMPADK